MSRKILGFARRNAIALLALVVALGGTAYAGSKIGANDIAANAVRGKHIKKNAVRSSDVKEDTLAAGDIAGVKTLAGGAKFINVDTSAGSTRQQVTLAQGDGFRLIGECTYNAGSEEVEAELLLVASQIGSLIAHNSIEDPVIAGTPATETAVAPEEVLVSEMAGDPPAQASDHGTFAAHSPGGGGLSGVFLISVNDSPSHDCSFATNAVG